MAQSLTLNKTRIQSIDLLRGLVMIIMALDHTRDFVHTYAWTEDPLSMQTSTPALYFTRWITHFCAPVFVFLSGMSAFLQSKRKSKKELSLFLIKRGFWLILVEVFVLNLIFSFDLSYSIIALQVIWVIGLGMLLLGLAIWLPFQVIFAIGLIILLGHNALDFYEKKHTGGFNHWYELLHRPSLFPLFGKKQLLILYPFLPWLGLMFCGYCFGKLVSDRQGIERKKLLLFTGFGLILLFVVMRMINIYGDPAPWSRQKDGLFTFLSFMNVSKYPPSLLYLSITLGPALIFMAFFDEVRTRLGRFISVYGRVAFFYYIIHFLYVHLLCVLLFFIRGHSWSEREPSNDFFPFFVIPGEGVTLWAVYLFWAFVVISLYPLCKWYDRYKMNHKEKWLLSYL
ncbi:MAG: DUF1624 domain-containing protein [Bacteroidota bacterium]